MDDLIEMVNDTNDYDIDADNEESVPVALTPNHSGDTQTRKMIS